MNRLDLSFFGAFQAQINGEPIAHFRSANVQGLLVYLALEAQRPHAREYLAALFWPDLPDSSAKKNLRQSIYQLRQLLEDTETEAEPFLLVTRKTVQFNAASNYALDVQTFLEALSEEAWETAVSIYQDTLLPGFTCDSLEFEDWLRLEREKLHQQALDALTKITAISLENGSAKNAQQFARRQLALEPWRESAHRQLIRALVMAGDRSAALAQYDACVAMLKAELGIAPERETVTLYNQIAAGEIEPAPKPAALASTAARTQTTPAPNRQAETVLLNKVQHFWVEGVLQQALSDNLLIELEMETAPEATANPWQGVVEPDIQRQSIAVGTPIDEIFAQNGRSLLILGEPGSGKTVLLLDLARKLIARAKNSHDEPLPAVFNLSSWSKNTPPLEQWLVDELNEKYLIPKVMGQAWIADERLLLLLDGLDEVKTDKRADCIAAINAFRQLHGLVPLAICCRTQVYQSIDVPLRVSGALEIRPLTVTQTNAYLNTFSAQLPDLQQTVADDPVLQEIVQSPLMLQVMHKAFRQSSDDLVQMADDRDSQNGSRKQTLLHTIFDAYVQRMLNQLAQTSIYHREQAQQWLIWLAKGMSAHNQSVFLIETMQPGWLATRRQRWIYILATRLLLGVGMGLILWLVGLMGAQLGTNEHSRLSVVLAGRLKANIVWVDFVNALLINSMLGLLVGVVDIVFFERRLRHSEQFSTKSSWDWPRLTTIGLVVGLAIGAFLLLTGESLLLMLLQLFVEPFLFMLLAHFAFGQSYDTDIETVEALGWSWKASLRGVGLGIILGGLCSLLIWQLFPTDRTMIQIILLVGLPMVLFLMVLSGLTHNHLETRTRPNQGIWLSVRNALFSGLLTGFLVGLLIVFVRMALQFQGVAVGAFFSIIAGSAVGLATGLAFGGFNLFKHGFLRLILWRTRQMPHDLIAFLNHAARNVLLYKVGGGYIFIHRLLQEHLAQIEEFAQVGRFR